MRQPFKKYPSYTSDNLRKRYERNDRLSTNLHLILCFLQFTYCSWRTVMNYELPVINLKDWYTLVSVWEQSTQGWRRLCTVRLPDARKLCNQPNRLVFPTNIDLNTKHKFSKDSLKICKLIVTKQRILERIEKVPGQTTVALANQLDISVATLRQHLNLLQDENLIRYYPDPFNKRIKRFYVGENQQVLKTCNS